VADRLHTSSSPRTGVVWDALRTVLTAGPAASAGAARDGGSAAEVLDIVDVGGGTGGFAVPLAELGHHVTVVDPSPDALAALQRRARDAGVDVRAVQGDADGLLQVVDAESAHLVLCHGVLERVDDVSSALGPLSAALRPGGAISVIVANRNAVVLARAVAGRFADARHALDDPAGRWGTGDPLPRRFTEDELVAALAGAGLQVAELHGVRPFGDLVPGAVIDGEPGAYDDLNALESALANHAAFRAIAAQLHVLARRP